MSGMEKRPEQDLVFPKAPQREADDAPEGAFRTLPSRVHVQALAVDRSQHLWGCGDGGVVRWTITGTHISFKVWHHEHGLAGSDARCLIFHKDRVFVGHASGQVSVYAHKTWSVLPLSHYFPIRHWGLVNDRLMACTDVGLLDINDGSIMPTPAPVLNLTVWQGHIWIGTTTGVWCLKETQWWPMNGALSLEPEPCLVQTGGDQLWCYGHGHLISIDTAHRVSKWPVNTTIHTLLFQGGNIIASTSQGIQYLSRKGLKKVQDADYIGTVLLQFALGWVLVGVEGVTYITPAEKYALLPESQDVPPDAIQHFKVNEASWIQSSDGVVWLYSGALWKKITVIPQGMLMGVIEFQGQIILGFDLPQGLGLFENGHIRMLDHLSFAVGLCASSDCAWIATLEALYQSVDGQNWTSIPYPVDMKGIAGVFIKDNELEIETSEAVYHVQNGALYAVKASQS